MEEKHERARIELIRFEEIDMITASAATQMTGLVLPRKGYPPSCLVLRVR